MGRKKGIVLLVLVTVVATTIVFSLRPISQPQNYHHFCDNRLMFDIPSFANVISNIGFIVVGLMGLCRVRQSVAPKIIKIIYIFVFMGIFLTAFGSAFYHYSPNNATLVYDRLPMTIVFMAITAAALAEGVGLVIGGIVLAPLLLIGCASILWWRYSEIRGSGDLRLYALVQYYPVILIPLILLLFPNFRIRKGWPPLLLCFGWYALAKIAEGLDCKIYVALGQQVSGHTIKHVAATIATGYLVQRFRLMHDDPISSMNI